MDSRFERLLEINHHPATARDGATRPTRRGPAKHLFGAIGRLSDFVTLITHLIPHLVEFRDWTKCEIKCVTKCGTKAEELGGSEQTLTGIP
jgi:hypothetical protein